MGLISFLKEKFSKKNNEFQKAKELDVPRLRLIMEAVLPQIAYEFDMNEMLSIIKIMNKVFNSINQEYSNERNKFLFCFIII